MRKLRRRSAFQEPRRWGILPPIEKKALFLLPLILVSIRKGSRFRRKRLSASLEGERKDPPAINGFESSVFPSQSGKCCAFFLSGSKKSTERNSEGHREEIRSHLKEKFCRLLSRDKARCVVRCHRRFSSSSSTTPKRDRYAKIFALYVVDGRLTSPRGFDSNLLPFQVLVEFRDIAAEPRLV